jgi:hypothetical protein
MAPNFRLFLHSLDLLGLWEVGLPKGCFRVIKELLLLDRVTSGSVEHLFH